MNSYENILKLVKPEVRSLYYLEKSKSSENTFTLRYRQGNKEHHIPVLTFQNCHNPIILHGNGKNPFISEVSSVYAKMLYKNFIISDDVIDVIDYIIESNMKKYELHLFFDNIFGGHRPFKKSRFLTSSGIRVNHDFSEIDYIFIDYIYDITFDKESPTPADKSLDGINKVELFGRLKSYERQKKIIIDTKNCVIFEEDENGVPVQIKSIQEFKENDIVEVSKIKEVAKEFLNQKINDIDEFKWSLS